MAAPARVRLTVGAYDPGEQRPRTVRLSDGRELAFAEFGDAAGRPVVYFHGFPGSRLEGRLVDAIAVRRRVRIVAVDRPGYGASDDRPQRRLLDWPADVAQLADALGLDRFGVIGVSGGGPYAAVCAHALPERLDAIGIVCGLGPTDDPSSLAPMASFNRHGLALARRAPWLCRPIFVALAPAFRRRPELLVEHLTRRVGEPDRAFLERPELRQIFIDTFREAFRRSARGPARDARIYAAPWGFELRDVRVRVHLWHGERDRIVPAAMGRRVAAELPDCRATFFPDEGHFSLALTRVDEMFDALSG